MKEAEHSSVTIPVTITHEAEGVWFLQNDFKLRNKSGFKKKKEKKREMCDKIARQLRQRQQLQRRCGTSDVVYKSRCFLIINVPLVVAC